jgi:hypothetical protein
MLVHASAKLSIMLQTQAARKRESPEEARACEPVGGRGQLFNVEDTLQRTSVTLAAVSHDAWAADVCATP